MPHSYEIHSGPDLQLWGPLSVANLPYDSSPPVPRPPPPMLLITSRVISVIIATSLLARWPKSQGSIPGSGEKIFLFITLIYCFRKNSPFNWLKYFLLTQLQQFSITLHKIIDGNVLKIFLLNVTLCSVATKCLSAVQQAYLRNVFV
jgi:hypothetical protein